MPHVIVKLYGGRTEEQKKELADELTRAVMKVLKSKEASIYWDRRYRTDRAAPSGGGIDPRCAHQWS